MTVDNPILAAIQANGWLCADEIATVTGLDTGTVNDALDQLFNNDKLIKCSCKLRSCYNLAIYSNQHAEQLIDNQSID